MNRLFRPKKSQIEKIQQISANRGPYFCPNCNRKFQTFPVFSKHMKGQCVASENTAEVSLTSYKSNSKGAKHITLSVEEYYYGSSSGNRIQHQDKTKQRMTCFNCQKVLRNNIRFMGHVRHKIQNSWQENDNVNHFNICYHCYRHYDSPFHLQCHLETVHAAIPAASTCQICEVNFENERLLLLHMKTEHCRDEMPYKCSLCGYRSSFYSNLLQHFRKTHDDTRSLLCPFCLIVFNSANYFLKHVFLHKIFQKKGVRCARCRLQFISLANQKKHFVNDHVSVKNPDGKNHLPSDLSDYQVTINLMGAARKKLFDELSQPDSASEALKVDRDIDSLKLMTTTANVENTTMSIRLPQHNCESRCLECGLILPFNAAEYKKHFNKLYKCKSCPFRSHCYKATGAHIRSFHVDEIKSEEVVDGIEKTPDSSNFSNMEKRPSSEEKKTLPNSSAVIKASKSSKARNCSIESDAQSSRTTEKSQTELDSILDQVASTSPGGQANVVQDGDKPSRKISRKQSIPKKVSKQEKKVEKTEDASDALQPLPTPRQDAMVNLPTAETTAPESASETDSTEKQNDENTCHKTFTAALGLRPINEKAAKRVVNHHPPSMFNPYIFSPLNRDKLPTIVKGRRFSQRTLIQGIVKRKTALKSIVHCSTPSKRARVEDKTPAEFIKSSPPKKSPLKSSQKRKIKTSKSSPKSKQTHSALKAQPVPTSKLWFSDVTNKSLVVHWKPVTGCKLSHYRLSFQGVGFLTVQELPPEQHSVRLVGLRSSTTYQVRLTSYYMTLKSRDVEEKVKTLDLRHSKVSNAPVKVVEFIDLSDNEEDCSIVHVTETEKVDRPEIERETKTSLDAETQGESNAVDVSSRTDPLDGAPDPAFPSLEAISFTNNQRLSSESDIIMKDCSGQEVASDSEDVDILKFAPTSFSREEPNFFNKQDRNENPEVDLLCSEQLGDQGLLEDDGRTLEESRKVGNGSKLGNLNFSNDDDSVEFVSEVFAVKIQPDNLETSSEFEQVMDHNKLSTNLSDSKYPPCGPTSAGILTKHDSAENNLDVLDLDLNAKSDLQRSVENSSISTHDEILNVLTSARSNNNFYLGSNPVQN